MYDNIRPKLVDAINNIVVDVFNVKRRTNDDYSGHPIWDDDEYDVCIRMDGVRFIVTLYVNSNHHLEYTYYDCCSYDKRVLAKFKKNLISIRDFWKGLRK